MVYELSDIPGNRTTDNAHVIIVSILLKYNYLLYVESIIVPSFAYMGLVSLVGRKAYSLGFDKPREKDLYPV
jgi:hypothetical protein